MIQLLHDVYSFSMGLPRLTPNLQTNCSVSFTLKYISYQSELSCTGRYYANNNRIALFDNPAFFYLLLFFSVVVLLFMQIGMMHVQN